MLGPAFGLKGFAERHHLFQGAVFQPGPNHPEAVFRPLAMGMAQIDPSVGLKIRIHRHIQQPGLARDEYFRQTGHRFRRQSIFADQPQAARPFGDQQGTVGQPRHAPGMGQAADHDVAAIAGGHGHVVSTQIGLGRGRAPGRGQEQQCQGQTGDRPGSANSFWRHLAFLRPSLVFPLLPAGPPGPRQPSLPFVWPARRTAAGPKRASMASRARSTRSQAASARRAPSKRSA